MNLRLAVLATTVGAILATAAPCGAQAKPKPNVIETKSAQGRGTTADPNIKKDEITNTVGKEMPAPPAKGGDKSRGAMVGYLTVINKTPWYVRMYVDGDYRGTLAPWGDWTSWGGCDTYTLYAVAPFDNGTSRSWGPARTNGTCADQHWTLQR